MLSCLIGVLIVAIIAIVVVYVLETAVGPLLSLPPPVWLLVRLVAGLIVLVYALRCLGVLGRIALPL